MGRHRDACIRRRGPVTERRWPTSVVDGAIGFLEVGDNQGPAYDVSLDGQRFLMIRGNEPPRREIVIVQHWFEELKRLLAN